MTVADKIRNFNDERLACYLCDVSGGVIKDTNGEIYRGKDEILRWLKSNWVRVIRSE